MNIGINTAVTYGTFTTLAAVLLGLVWLITQDDDLVEQRASRLGLLAGFASTGLSAGIELVIYYGVDARLGGFLPIGCPAIGRVPHVSVVLIGNRRAL